MNQDFKQKKTVIVMGAGLAGLTAACELTKKKAYEVIVFEKERQVGGLAKTIKVGNFRFDTGPHRWYSKQDMVNRWLKQLMDKQIIKVPRLTRIYFDKKFFYYPIRLKNALFNIGLLKATQGAIDYIIVRVKTFFFKDRAITLEDGYISKFGKTLYEIFFKRYSEKLWGRSCRQISADWISQRTRGFNIASVVKDAILPSKKVVSFVDEFFYPKLGIGAIAQTLASKTRIHGGKIRLKSPITKIKVSKQKVEFVEIRQNGKRRNFYAEEFISSIPLNDLISHLAPQPPKEILAINQKLKYRDEIQVVLLVNKAHLTQDTWIYVHPKELAFVRFMEMDNWSNQLQPEGKTAIVFEIVCNIGDKVWQMSDQDLIKMITEQFISEFSLIKRSDILDAIVHRVEKEYPVYHLEYKEDTKKLKEFLAQFKNLQIIGRNGTFRYNNMDHSIEMGLYAAWNIIEGKKKYDINSVNIEREYLEEKHINNI